MSRLAKSPGMLLSLIAVAALAACAPQGKSTGSANPVAKQAPGGFDPAQPVTIAVLTPSSASNEGAARLGKALVNAAEMARADLGDPLITVKYYDTAGDALQAVSAANQAVADGAKLIIGPLFGANTEAIAPIAANANIKIVSFSTDSSIGGGPIYLSGFLPEKAAGRITSFARGQGYSRLGIFYPETAYGDVSLRGAKTTSGPALVAATPYERSEEGIPPAAAKFASQVKDQGARGLLIAESGRALSFVAAQLQEQGLSGGDFKYLGLGEWNTAVTRSSRTLRGGWFPAPDPGAMSAFAKRYRNEFKAPPPPLAILGYDGMQIAGQLLATARAEGSKDPFGDAALTRPTGFRGIVGPIRFDPNGFGERSMAIMEVRRNDFRVIDPAPTAFGAGS